MNTNFDSDKIYLIASSFNIPSSSIDNCQPLLANLYIADENQTFFKQILNYSSNAIRQDLLTALSFFQKKFGLQFCNQIQDSNNTLSIPGATLVPYKLALPLELLLTNIGRTTANVYDGGWMVMIDKPGYIGMIDDVPTYYEPGTVFLFGFQKMVFPDNSNKMYHYVSAEPHHLSSTIPSYDHVALNFNICDLETRQWGTSLGIVTLSPCANNIYIQWRQTLNFSSVQPLMQSTCPTVQSNCSPRCANK